jgi:NitT/TauT family transport system substrate-binding protein
MKHFLRFARACALVSCCVASAVVALPRPAAADDTLNLVGGSFPTAFFEILIDVAERAGYYKEQHLIVNVNYAGNPSVAIQAVAAGKGDIAAGNLNGIVVGYDKGVRMTAFLSRGPHLQGVLGVLASSSIHSLADFKGKTIGETSLGQPGEIFTAALLAGAGLKKSDFSFAPIGIGSQAIAALTSGRVDAIAQPFPQLRIYEVTGGLKFRYFFQPILNDVPDDAFFTSPSIIQSKGDLLKRFSRAIVKASIFIHENPQLAAKYFVEMSGMKVTDDAIAGEVKLLKVSQDLLPAADPMSKTIGLIPLRGIRLYNKFMYDNGLTSQIVPAESVVTDQFIEYANDFDHAAFITEAKAAR